MRAAVERGEFNETDVIDSCASDLRPAFRVRVGYEFKANFDDLRDAIEAARMMKRDNPTRSVAVVDAKTGLFVIDFD